MEEFDTLVEKICSPTTDSATRAQCERRILENLDKDSANWKVYLQALFQCSDAAKFFI